MATTNDGEEVDLTEWLKTWLREEFDESDITRVTAGIVIGLAFAVRHPEHLTMLHEELTEDYKHRIAGSPLLYEVGSIAAGEHRTSPEKLADELAEALVDAALGDGEQDA